MVVNSGLWRVEMPSFLNIRPISYTFSNPPTCHYTIQTIVKDMKVNSKKMLQFKIKDNIDSKPPSNLT